MKRARKLIALLGMTALVVSSFSIQGCGAKDDGKVTDRKSTRLNSSH